MMTRETLIALIATTIAATSLGAVALISPTQDRPDCPGKIVCPLTGEIVCRDRCPAVDPSRPDCPGRIECPLTGELICRDQCPIDAQEDVEESDAVAPVCCQNRN